MKIWTVANQKGGVGKTTTTVAIAGLLADIGQNVLVIDLDPHGSMSSWFGYDPDTLENSVYNLFNEGQLPGSSIRELVSDTSHERVKLMPSSIALATLERQSIGRGGQGLILSRALGNLSEDFNYVLIDSPPVLGILMLNALAACQQLIIPVQTEFLAVKGLQRMIKTLSMVNRSRNAVLPYTIVPTLFDRRTQASLGTLRLLRDSYPDQLWKAYIPVDTRLRDASKAGLAPSRFDASSRGVIAYRILLKQLLTRQLRLGGADAGTAT